MRELSLEGVSRRKGTRTTKRDQRARPAPDLVERDFSADAPDRLWVADVTHVPTWAGFLFLAVVVDAFSRRVVGWSMANHMRTALVLDALNMALAQRRPEEAVIHHSDQGTQYTSIAFGKRCQAMNVPAPDLVERDFSADAPDRLWVADVTHVPTWAGFLFLAVVVDAFSRRVVGWSMANHMRTALVLDALNMALAQRRPEEAVIHHSDQGTQYTSIAFGKRCQAMNVRPSMGSVGDCYDNYRSDV